MNSRAKYLWQAGAAAFTGMLLAALLLLLAVPLPAPLFDGPYATPVYDREGGLLSVAIAADDQWRFPVAEQLPERYRRCLIRFEDRRFYLHPGVDPAAVLRALRQNLEAGRIVSGASTISMQTIRLSRAGRSRSLFEKVIEAVLALKLELRYSKHEILALYAAHAPFGGNTIGLPAAAWRYFGRPPSALSWSEAALLAVLPNQPSRIFPGRNRDLLQDKRDLLLRDLHQQGIIEEASLQLALAEPLPEGTIQFPRRAPHLLTRHIEEGGRGSSLYSSLDDSLQRRVAATVQRHHVRLRESGIHNAAAVVLSLESGRALAYVGNVQPENQATARRHGTSVDIVSSVRSPGSLLKPFLYALALDDGLITPDQLLPDIPMFFKEFVPRNYSYEFYGAVPASQALIRSLNVPFVYLAREYDYTRFYRQLQRMGLQFPRPAAHYGISLILGGAEASLWDLSALFAGFGRTLLHAQPGGSRQPGPYFSNTYRLGEGGTDSSTAADTPAGAANLPVSAGAVWTTFEAMQELVRPEAQQSWRRFTSARPIAWKTGTSMGFKDAWSVGVTPEYVVAVWIGNADGEGRPGINGLFAAAPLLFDVFDLLPTERQWFSPPRDQLRELEVCSISGMKASKACPETRRAVVPAAALRGQVCPHHQVIHLNQDETRRVDSSVYPVAQMKTRRWFILPPVQAWYYKHYHPEYRDPPPAIGTDRERMRFIYPAEEGAVLKLPRDFGDTGQTAVFRVAHRDPETELYWHLDGRYLASTRGFHELGIQAEPGGHRITVVDEHGNSLSRQFSVTAN